MIFQALNTLSPRTEAGRILAQPLRGNAGINVPGFGNGAKQDRTCANGRLIRDGKFGSTRAPGPYHASVSETRIAMERCGRMTVVKRPDR